MMDLLLRGIQDDEGNGERLKEVYVDLLKCLSLETVNERSRPDTPRLRMIHVAGNLLNGMKEVGVGLRELKGTGLRQDLNEAFLVLCAKKGIEIEKESLNEEETVVCPLRLAKALERRVVRLVRVIGDILTHGQKTLGANLRCDPVFEYFSEKDMFSLLVQMALSTPQSKRRISGVTWSPAVKTEVLQTIARLISNAQTGTSLYFLLSSDHINTLLTDMLPLSQWTRFALDMMLPGYVAVLQGLCQHLSIEPEPVCAFLKIETNGIQQFPLLTAIVGVATSMEANLAAKSESLQLVVAVMRLKNKSVRTLMNESTLQQRKLCISLCTRLMDRYNHLARLTIGPVVDPSRSNIVQDHMNEMTAQLDYLDELFKCGIRPLNVRLCELLLRRVVLRMVQKMKSNTRGLLAVGMADTDVIPRDEALAQTAMVFLAHLWGLSYLPLLRMLSVLCFHPSCSGEWSHQGEDEYFVTKELNRIAQTEEDLKGSKDSRSKNTIRTYLLSLLSGKMGEWSFVPATMILEGLFRTKGIDLEFLDSVGIVTKDVSSFEEALGVYMLRQHSNVSVLSTTALERASTTLLYFCQKVWLYSDANDRRERLESSPLYSGLLSCLQRFCKTAGILQGSPGVGEIFCEIVDQSIRARYSKLSDDRGHRGKFAFGCLMDQFQRECVTGQAELLVRKYRFVRSNDVEDARFFVKLVLHLRAIWTVVEGWYNNENEEKFVAIPAVDWADKLILEISDMKRTSVMGSEVDMKGLSKFRCHPPADMLTVNEKEDILPKGSKHNPSHLQIVLGRKQFLVVAPFGGRGSDRGTVLCAVSMHDIIAFAPDENWLHVAIRNIDDVECLVRNGNLALAFDSTGECLRVLQLLRRTQENLRGHLDDKIQSLLRVQAHHGRVESRDCTV